MPIVVQCDCGKRFAARDDLAGKTLGCPACGQSITVPGSPPPQAPVQPPAKPASSAAAPQNIVVTCTCGARFAARADLAGKTLGCPKCGASLTVPGPPSPSPPRQAPQKPAAPKAPAPPPPPAASVPIGLGDLLDDVGLTPTKTGIRCQKCRADMKPGAVLCVQCGYNHETGAQTQTKKWS